MDFDSLDDVNCYNIFVVHLYVVTDNVPAFIYFGGSLGKALS